MRTMECRGSRNNVVPDPRRTSLVARWLQKRGRVHELRAELDVLANVASERSLHHCSEFCTLNNAVQ